MGHWIPKFCEAEPLFLRFFVRGQLNAKMSVNAVFGDKTESGL